MRVIRALGTALAAALALAACVPRTAPPAPQPAPPPLPAPAPPPPRAPEPAPPPLAWQDGPLSQGDWRYDPSPRPRAAFGAGDPLFAVECTAARQISLARLGAAAGAPLVLRTTFGERSLPASGPAASVALLVASDPLLDDLAFSRGRFLVQAAGLPDLVVPTWPELARVVEDCRGQ